MWLCPRIFICFACRQVFHRRISPSIPEHPFAFEASGNRVQCLDTQHVHTIIPCVRGTGKMTHLVKGSHHHTRSGDESNVKVANSEEKAAVKNVKNVSESLRVCPCGFYNATQAVGCILMLVFLFFY